MKYTIFEDSQQAIFAWFCGHMNRGACQPQVWSLLLIWRPYETLHGIYSSLKFCKNCKNSGLKCKLWVINYFFMELLYNCWILELKTKKSRSFKYYLPFMVAVEFLTTIHQMKNFEDNYQIPWYIHVLKTLIILQKVDACCKLVLIITEFVGHILGLF